MKRIGKGGDTSYSQKMMADLDNRELESLLKQEVKELKEKYYGRADAFAARKKENLHGDLYEYIYGTQPAQSAQGLLLNQSASNVHSHLEISRSKPKSALRRSVNFDSKSAKSC